MTTDKSCIKCGKIAVASLFCLNCLLNMTAEEYNLTMLRIAFEEGLPDDEGDECKMCGKPNVYGGTDGMCSSCRIIWNG